MNEAFFERFYVEEFGAVDGVRRQPFSDLPSLETTYYREAHGAGAGAGVRDELAASDGFTGMDPRTLGTVDTVRGSSKTILVDLVSRYSNPVSPLLARVERILAMQPVAGSSTSSRPPVRVHKIEHRLKPDTIAGLVADYEAGHPTTLLMVKYDIGKGTALDILRRAGVQLRNQGLAPEQLEAAATLYAAGWSLVRLGQQFTCDAETIRKELKLFGVPMRKPWERVSSRPDVRGPR